MATLNIFYTYAWLRVDGTPYYIGKGSRGRAFDRRRKYCPPGDRVLILKKNLTESEAFRHEVYMIALFGRKNIGTGILHNKTDGGDGATGLRHTEESKSKIGQAQKGPRNVNYGRPETAKNITGLVGENSHNWGRKHTPQARNNMSKVKRGPSNPMYGKTGGDNPTSKPVLCVETQQFFCSAKEAQDITGINKSNIGACCRGERPRAGGFRWKFT